MATKVAVIGAGSWGTAVAAISASKTPTTLWARRAELADEINRTHTNERYLPGSTLPEALRSTSSLADAVADASVVVLGVPSHGFRDVVRSLPDAVPAGVPVISLTKGVEQGSLKRMTEVLSEELDGHERGVLTGPNLAKEVMAGYPAASVVAMTDQAAADEVQGLFMTDAFRVYTNPDVIGCELGGALKNVMAIAVGIADGMGFGDNTKAALMTRGLAELTRLGIALGGDPLTFAGLAGMGDLVATCMSPQSRNRHVGDQLGRGLKLDEIVAQMNMVAEGVKTSKAVVDLARGAGVETPIVDEVVAALYDDKPAAEILYDLMHREVKPELHGIRQE